MVQLLQGAGEHGYVSSFYGSCKLAHNSYWLPTEFVHMHISNCVSSCQNIKVRFYVLTFCAIFMVAGLKP
jgi:hypothetical protein